MRLVEAGTGMLDQPGWTVLLEAAEPLADGGDSGGEETRRRFDAALFGAFHQAQTTVVNGQFNLTHQIEIASGGPWCGDSKRRTPA